MLSKPRLIITCDDLGRSQSVNSAIISLLTSGRASAASLLVNHPAFESAVAAIRDSGLQDRVGLHLNLADSRPLVPECLNDPLLGDGEKWRIARRIWPAPRPTRQLIRREIDAQIKRFLDTGLRPTHLDSHWHLHLYPMIVRELLPAARTAGIPAVRIAHNWGPSRGGPIVHLYKRWINRVLRVRGFKTTRWFAGLRTLYGAWKQGRRLPPGHTIECNAHPAMLDERATPDQRMDMQLMHSDEFADFLRDFELISFAELVRGG